MTTSCTDALEMAAILVGIKEGDEVIVPRKAAMISEGRKDDPIQ